MVDWRSLRRDATPFMITAVVDYPDSRHTTWVIYMVKRQQLGDLQLAILRVLWTRGEASASHVHAALLEDRGLALTTIKTMLRKLEEKGVVTHRADGRTFIYQAALIESDVREGMVGYVVQRMFAGEGTALVNHLIETGEIDANELDELRARLAERRAEG